MKQYSIADPEKILGMINMMEFFKGFTSQEKKTLAAYDQHFASYEKGSVIIKEGDCDAFFYILLLGEVSVTKGNPPRSIANLEPGDWFGEISFLTGSPRTANVIANTHTALVIRMSREIIQKLDIKIREKIKDKLINRLVERLDHMNRYVLCVKNQVPASGPSPYDPTDIP